MIAFRFKDSPNPGPIPAPVEGTNPVRWSVEGYDPAGDDIVWSSVDREVVRVEPVASDRHSQAQVTAISMGMTQITATQGKESISAYVFVGDFLAYDGDGLHRAQSQLWSTTDPPRGCPTFEEMRDHGLALVPTVEGAPYLVLNFLNLHEVRGDAIDALYFFTAEAEGKSEGAGATLPAAYAYAPDGATLWSVGGDAWRKADRLEGIPEHDEMAMRRAALAWAPPDGFPVRPPRYPSPAIIAAVTCYVLDLGLLPAPIEDRTTFYTIRKVPPIG